MWIIPWTDPILSICALVSYPTIPCFFALITIKPWGVN